MTGQELTEKLVDTIVLLEDEGIPVKTGNILAMLDIPRTNRRRVQQQMTDLEALGILVRSGSHRHTEWHLG